MTRLSRLGWSLLLSLHTLSGIAALEPFRMPWNDASAGITNLQSWQPVAAGAEGWVTTTADGRYELSGQRIRFLGVNVTSADCFPPHDRAEAHAARLAKFGFNAVRFHHMEAPWDKANVLVDYAAGTSRTLAAARLERLHYFVAKLAEKGIYTNINLLVSREFQPTDGLGAEITQLGWKDQHVLGFFHDGALGLHKEYATALLTAPNPHRGGTPLGEDPAVAFVEIQNENGLAQKWYEGVLDDLPAPYAQALQARWNAWLKSTYTSTSALLTGWGAVDEPPGPNRLLNGDFSADLTSWNTIEQHSGAAATTTVTTDFDTKPALRIAVTTAGTAGWHVQFTQSNLALVAGQTYTLSFWAKAADATPLTAALTRTGPTDYSSVTSPINTTLGINWQQYSMTFQAAATENSVRLVFNGFGNRLATVWLADVQFFEGGKIGGLPEGATLETSTIPTVLRNPSAGSATAGQTRDWFEFMFDAEKTYWDAMKAHIVSTLGYPGIVWGTIISNSPPNTQAGLDAMDSHAYWQHPQFLEGLDWDPEHWTVTNTSMVNSPASNTLTGIARQRVKGYPHNVTEYQHSSPNTYASEGPLLAAAFGALQDWDSLWMFDYSTGTSEFVTGHLNHAGHPGKMANNLLAACLFRRGDVRPARRDYTMALTPAQEVELARTRGRAWLVADGALLDVPATLAFESRVSLDIGADAAGLPDVPAAPAGSVITADTEEIRWDTSLPNQGVVTIDTPRTKAVVGFVAGRSFDLGGVVIAPGTTRQNWCTIGLSLTTGQSFLAPAGAQGFIVTTGDLENTGQVWKDSSRNSVGTRWGSAPTLIEVVPATITLPVAANRVTVWALDGSGQRGTPVAVRDSGGRAQFDLGVSGTTLWYEFAISAGAESAPQIVTQPLTRVVAPGANVTLSVEAAGNPAPTIQWYRNGASVPGATGTVLIITAAGDADAGKYHAVATNSLGSVSTQLVSVALTGGFDPNLSRLVNVSTRGEIGTGDRIMIAGFVIAEGSRDVFVRTAGPSLSDVGLTTGTIADPQFALHQHGVGLRAVCDDWSGPEVDELRARLGASPSFNNWPKDAAAAFDLDRGIYTALASGADGGTGIALIEVYDAKTGPGRLVNLSTRALVGSGANALIVGFVIEGPSQKRVLIRGIGPSMALTSPFAAADLVGDPKLTLFRMLPGGGVVLKQNDDWQDWATSNLASTFQSVGAFALPPLSLDAAIDIWLEPGIYTAMMEPKTTGGLGLVEIYEVE